TDHIGYIAREKAKHSQLSTIDTVPMCVHAGATSSIGDIEALGIFRDFVPTVATAAGECVIVEGVSSVVRLDLPLMMLGYWQYNGQMSFNFHTSMTYQSDKDMDILVDAFKGWMLDLIA
ncbi:hypothetical protein HWV62_34421, partial [Athelia sp. TMB]